MEIYNLLTTLGISIAFGIGTTAAILIFVSLTFKKVKK